MVYAYKGVGCPMLLIILLQIAHSDSSTRSATFIQQASALQSTTESAGNNSFKGTTSVNLKASESVSSYSLTSKVTYFGNMKAADEEYLSNCPSNVECSKLGGECIKCKFNHSCVYGQETTVECEPKAKSIKCLGNAVFSRTMICRYCYQTETWEHNCLSTFNCKVVSNPRERELTNCTVKSDIICLGNRQFRKNPLCNWTDGYKWSTALILSITLGGFGADRFYLGHWQEGIGKLFSFGGLGIWTLLDVILIAVGYLSPANGSLYI